MSDATRVAIIGLGAIGGSAALKLLDRGALPRGYTASDSDRRLAAAAGIRVDDSIEAAVAAADLVLIAVPLDAVAAVARRVVVSGLPTATILHATTVQRTSQLGLDPAIAERLVGSHPLVNASSTGFQAAQANLFRGAVVSVEPRGTPRNREDAELFWSMAGASRIEYRDADEHDKMPSSDVDLDMAHAGHGRIDR